ncbi:MAG: ABC transporter substrate-binding protein [Spirochaetales bacterium]
MRLRTNTTILLVFFLIPAVLFAAGQGESGAGETIVVTTTNGPNENDQAEVARHQLLIEQFKEIRPDVVIEARDTRFDRQQFTAKIAAGTMEDAFLVDFTQPRFLIDRSYVADVTPWITEWEDFDDYNRALLQIVQDDTGDIYGLPVGGYSLGLIYNRDLFEQAGLDPNSPPQTWDELQQYAYEISQLGPEVAGFGALSTSGQGGWHFVAMVYSYGGSFLREGDGGWQADFVTEEALNALDSLQQMRWEDDSLTQQQLLDAADLVSLMAAGNLGMGIMAGDELRRINAQFGGDMSTFGMGPLPQGGGNATLAGGSAWMFNPNARPEVLEAAVQWSIFQTFENFENDIAAQAERGQLVGWPQLPVFTGNKQEEREAILERYANAPVQNYEPFNSATAIELRPEPPVETQKLYRDLDLVMQAVLTDPFADIEKVLRQVERQFQEQVLNRL